MSLPSPASLLFCSVSLFVRSFLFDVGLLLTSPKSHQEHPSGTTATTASEQQQVPSYHIAQYLQQDSYQDGAIYGRVQENNANPTLPTKRQKSYTEKAKKATSTEELKGLPKK